MNRQGISVENSNAIPGRIFPKFALQLQKSDQKRPDEPLFPPACPYPILAT
jgi:hypothetical protein